MEEKSAGGAYWVPHNLEIEGEIRAVQDQSARTKELTKAAYQSLEVC
jgi:hypothetical protein